MARKKGRRGRALDLDEDIVEEALRKNAGIYTAAAKSLGVTRTAIYYHVKKSERLQEVLVEIRESAIDLAESNLVQLLNAGDRATSMFWVKCHGKDRGWVEKPKIEQQEKSDLADALLAFAEKIK